MISIKAEFFRIFSWKYKENYFKRILGQGKGIDAISGFPGGGSGGGHGGRGGRAAGQILSGATYGSVLTPLNFGILRFVFNEFFLH